MKQIWGSLGFFFSLVELFSSLSLDLVQVMMNSILIAIIVIIVIICWNEEQPSCFRRLHTALPKNTYSVAPWIGTNRKMNFTLLSGWLEASLVSWFHFLQISKNSIQAECYLKTALPSDVIHRYGSDSTINLTCMNKNLFVKLLQSLMLITAINDWNCN